MLNLKVIGTHRKRPLQVFIQIIKIEKLGL